MKLVIAAAAAVCAVGALAGCSSQATPANNDIQYVPPIPAVSPVPETTATLVPGPNHTDVTTETWRLPMFKDYDPQRLASEKAGIGGSVGAEDFHPAGVGGNVGGEGK
jgi:hypothetical protein